MRTHALALVGMMVVSLGLAGCKTCCCCDSWGGLCGESPTPEVKPTEAKGQPLTKNFSPTQNMQIAATPPAQWNNAPAAKLAMPQNGEAQMRVTTATTTPAATTPVVPADGTVRSNWNAATPAAVTPVSATVPTPSATTTPMMEEMPTRRSISMPAAPMAPERETFEVTAPQPTATAAPEPTAPTQPATDPVAPFGTPRGEN